MGVARKLRSGLAIAGILPVMDRWATRSRLALWSRSLLAIYDVEDLAKLNAPWWTFKSIDLIDEYLVARPGARVFEWGSGASTVWLATRGASVTAVEHDPEWASAVEALLPPEANAEIRVVQASPAAGRDGEIRSGKRGHEDLNFSDYVEAIDVDDCSYDLIIVDGRAREECLRRAIPRLSKNGLLLFDDAERRRYRQAIANAADEEQITMTSGFGPCLPYPTRTAIVRNN